MQAGSVTAARQTVLPPVVRLHADEAATLWGARALSLHAPGMTLKDVGRLDDRLQAHLDGLAIAGEPAWIFCEQGLAPASAGGVFTAAVRALEERRRDRLDRICAVAEAMPEARCGLTAAFGWVEPARLQGVVADYLASPHAFRRLLGLTACAMHRVDPGDVLRRFVVDEDAAVRERAFRSVGELGLRRFLPAFADATEEDPGCRFRRAWAAALLGERRVSPAELARIAVSPGRWAAPAFTFVLLSLAPAAAHAVLQQLARDPSKLRWLIEGSGLAGDPRYVPWLIRQMADDRTARPAGAAFALITGADLGPLGLERDPPSGGGAGEDGEMDRDEGLPWPDPERVDAWWRENETRFREGTRSFMGAPVTREHCVWVLTMGYQPQRSLAAQHLSLLEPGRPLFNTSAPTRRQQRLLASMR